MRDLQDKKELDVRLKRSENNVADIMTKNTMRDVHDKHTQQVRDGTLQFWKEDVKQGSSMTEFTNSRISTESHVTSSLTTSDTVKSRTSKQLLESKAGSQSACTLL
jgi:superoxide dismutase